MKKKWVCVYELFKSTDINASLPFGRLALISVDLKSFGNKDNMTKMTAYVFLFFTTCIIVIVCIS